MLLLALLDQVAGVLSSYHLDRLAVTDRLDSESGLKLGAMGAVLSHLWETLVSGSVPNHIC